MRLRNRLAQLAMLACAAALPLLLAAPAQAVPRAATANPEARVVALVLHAGNPAAAFGSLTTAQKALFIDAQKHMSGTVVISRGGPVGSTTSSPTGPLVVTPNANGCWFWYWYVTWDDFGYSEGDTWDQLNWCGSGGKITSHSITNIGGKSDSVFFTYDGVIGKFGNIYSVSGHQEWRQIVEYKFSVQIPKVFTGTANPCEQTRGGSTGLVSDNFSCNLEA